MNISGKKILVVSPHPDDETLGAGGFIKKLVENDNIVNVLTVSGHLPPLYDQADYDITESEAREAYNVLGVERFSFLKIPATYVSEEPVSELNGKIGHYFEEFEPSVVLCPFPDRHIDHRVIFDSVMVASRPVGYGKKINMLATYETLSETHWNAPYVEPNFNHNIVVDISDQIETKLDALRLYKSQIDESEGPRSVEAVRALAKFRGSQAGFSYGEAFYLIRQTY